jgi:hypothetical protein
MPISTYLKNAWLNTLRGGGAGTSYTAPTTVYASLHTADPGDNGASEVSGGSPAYARKSLTSAAASAGSMASSNTPVFDVPACTVTHVGYWDAVTAGNYLGNDPVTNEVFAAQGTYTLTANTLAIT